jgi:hypothetical protein
LAVADNVKPADRQDIETRMRNEVLETARYQEIRYQGNEMSGNRIADDWYRVRFQGELSLHGVTWPQPVEAQMRLQGDALRLGGEFTLLQSHYRIKKVTALGGMITLKDELKFSFDILCRKEEQSS